MGPDAFVGMLWIATGPSGAGRIHWWIAADPIRSYAFINSKLSLLSPPNTLIRDPRAPGLPPFCQLQP